MNLSRNSFRCGVLLLAGITALAALSGCGRSKTAAAVDDGRLRVAVSILPQVDIVGSIGGDAVQIELMVGPGDSPERYEPSTARLRALRDTALYLSIGVPFETTWLPRFAAMNPGMRVVDTIAGIDRMPMLDGHAHHGGHPAARHDDQLDPHVWLSPALVRRQAVVITEALVSARPGRAAYFRERMDAFAQRLDELDKELREILADLPSRRFIVFHPAWGYFARDYDLEMIPVERGGQEPSAAELAAVLDIARRDNIRVIFTQPEVSSASARVIAGQIDGRVVEISPLAGDLDGNLKRVARAIAAAVNDG